MATVGYSVCKTLPSEGANGLITVNDQQSSSAKIFQSVAALLEKAKPSYEMANLGSATYATVLILVE